MSFFCYIKLSMSSSPGGAVHLATRTGTNFAGAACDLSPPAPTNSTSFRLFYEVAHARCKTLKQAWCFTRLAATLWESRSSPLLRRELQLLLRFSLFVIRLKRLKRAERAKSSKMEK